MLMNRIPYTEIRKKMQSVEVDFCRKKEKMKTKERRWMKNLDKNVTERGLNKRFERIEKNGGPEARNGYIHIYIYAFICL